MLNEIKAINETYLHEKIKDFSKLRENWDGLGTPAPTAIAIENASFVMSEMFKQDIVPDSINPTSDDSIVIQVYYPISTKSNRFYLFECFNNGDIVFLKKQHGEREVIDLQKWDIPSAIAQISRD